MTLSIPNVHEFDREIPAGKVLLAECRSLSPADRRVKREVIKSRIGWGRTKVTLEARYAGWNIAGSMMRWDNGSYAVAWEVNGTLHSRAYRNFDDALAHFNRIPA